MNFHSFDSRINPKCDCYVAVASRVRAVGVAHLLALALCLVGLASTSCGSNAAGGVDERSCQGDVGADCPATFDDVLAATWSCQSGEVISAGECMAGGPLTLNRNWGVYQTNCFYDPVSRKLVGANVVNDTPAYCNNTSASMSEGNVPVPYPHYCVGNSSSTQRSMNCGSSQP
jgi:hypothetical protein